MLCLEVEIDAGPAEPAIVLEAETVVARGARRHCSRRPEIDIQRFDLERPIARKGPFAAAAGGPAGAPLVAPDNADARDGIIDVAERDATGGIDQQRRVGKRPADAAADRREHRNFALL